MIHISEFQSNITKVTRIYVDSSRPDDTGNGLSWATAKKTLTAGLDIVNGTIARAQIFVHVKGTHTISQDYHFNVIPQSGQVWIDGGSDVTLVEASTFDAPSGSETLINITQTIATNRRGYWVKITNGARSGDMRTIYEMPTTTSLNPTRAFFTGISFPFQFQIVRPATVITSSNNSVLSFSSMLRTVNFQRMEFTGSLGLNLIGNATVNSCLFNNYNTTNGYIIKTDNANGSVVNFTDVLYDIDNDSVPTRTDQYMGISSLTKDMAKEIIINSCNYFQIYGGFLLNPLRLNNSYLTNIAVGQTLTRLIMEASNGIDRGIVPLSTDQPVRFIEGGGSGSAASGIYLNNSSLFINSSNGNGWVDVARSGDGYDYGVYLADKSVVKLQGRVAGVADVAGVYLNNRNYCRMVNSGGAPTVAKSGDATYAVMTKDDSHNSWANIDGGTVITDATNLNVAREE